MSLIQVPSTATMVNLHYTHTDTHTNSLLNLYQLFMDTCGLFFIAMVCPRALYPCYGFPQGLILPLLWFAPGPYTLAMVCPRALYLGMSGVWSRRNWNEDGIFPSTCTSTWSSWSAATSPLPCCRRYLIWQVGHTHFPRGHISVYFKWFLVSAAEREGRRRLISKSFHHQLKYHEKQPLVGMSGWSRTCPPPPP